MVLLSLMIILISLGCSFCKIRDARGDKEVLEENTK
jgi:hypothetical protein